MEHGATVRFGYSVLMDALTQARQQLDALLADLEQREQSVAQAAEQLSQEPAIAAAWQQGGMAERDRVVALIDHQLDQLSRGGVNAIVLTALRRQVLEVEA
jgi:CheY-like chemotaxis protein